MKPLHQSAFRCAGSMLAIALSGCGDTDIVAYRVPKEKAPIAAAADAHPTPAQNGDAQAVTTPAAAASGMTGGPAVATAAGASLTWSAPAHWQPKAASAMRKGTYIIAGENGTNAELAITAFPGDVGGEVANVNRWRGQLQLPPLPDKEVPATVARLANNELTLGVVDFANTSAPTPQRIVGAMVPFARATWFFKMTGPDVTVAKEKSAFLEFLKTVKSAAPVSP